MIFSVHVMLLTASASRPVEAEMPLPWPFWELEAPQQGRGPGTSQGINLSMDPYQTCKKMHIDFK